MTKQTNAVAPWNPTMSLPAAALADTGLGNENVRAEDQLIPRLNLLQAMSPEVTKGSERYVDGAQAGDIMNSITTECFEAVYCANLDFKVDYTVWRKRQKGGGLYGTFPTEEIARQTLAADPDVNSEDYDIQETHIHLLVLLDEEGNVKTPVICQMSSSKLKTSRQWNSMPQIKQGARFASIWTLSSKPAKAPNGAVYYTYNIEFAGFAPDALYADLKKAYTDLGLDKH